MAGRICYIFLLLAAGTGCAFYGSRALLALTAALLLLPLLAAGTHLFQRKKLRAELSAPASLEKDQIGAVTLTLKNSGWLPAGRAVCRLRMTNLLTGGEETRTVTLSAGPGETRTAALEFQSGHCGRVRVRLERLRLYDPFGLFGVPAGEPEEARITVQPVCFPQNVFVSADADEPDDGETYSLTKQGYDLSEVWQLRDYCPGDNLRQIHWKLSGKLDRLVIRDGSLPVSRSVLIFWERTQQCGPEDTDAQADIFVSACRALLESGVSFTAAWNEDENGSGACVMQEIRSLDELAGLLPRLLSARAAEGRSGAELLSLSREEGGLMHVLYITEIFRRRRPGWRGWGA